MDELTLENLTLSWLKGFGYAATSCLATTPGEPPAGSMDYARIFLQSTSLRAAAQTHLRPVACAGCRTVCGGGAVMVIVTPLLGCRGECFARTNITYWPS